MLKTTLAALAAATALLSAAPAAQAQDLSAVQRQDLQCFLIYMYLVGDEADAGNAEARSGLMTGVGYFLGRLEAGAPDRDWFAYIESNVALAETLVSEQAAYQRCGQDMISLGGRMITFGERMQALAG